MPGAIAHPNACEAGLLVMHMCKSEYEHRHMDAISSKIASRTIHYLSGGDEPVDKRPPLWRARCPNRRQINPIQSSTAAIGGSETRKNNTANGSPSQPLDGAGYTGTPTDGDLTTRIAKSS